MKEKFKMLSTSILVMLMVFLIPQMVFASTEIPTQTSEFYINDFADVLTDEEEKIMLHNAEALEDEYEGTQIVVTTVPNTGDMEADDYSFEMYDKYKIGNIKQSNLYNVWEKMNEKFGQLSCSQKSNKCKNCKGGCRARALKLHNNIMGIDDVYCTIMKGDVNV